MSESSQYAEGWEIVVPLEEFNTLDRLNSEGHSVCNSLDQYAIVPLIFERRRSK